MRRLIGCLAAIALLVIVPAASAKVVHSAVICGDGGCASISKQDGRPRLQALAEGGNVVGPPAHGAPYYRVNVEIRGGDARARYTNHWVPSLDLIRGQDGTWMEMPAEGKAGLAALTAKLKPLPASTLPLSASADSLAMARIAAISTPAPVVTAPSNDGGGFPWSWILAAAAAAGLTVTIAARRRRRTGAPRQVPGRGRRVTPRRRET
jgi:hypothetical protein